MRVDRRDAVVVAAAGLAVYAMKRYYSSAGAVDLAWILAPTTFLVELLTGVRFVAETRIGFVSRELNFAIAPACAGVNFLLIVFLTFVLGFVRQLATGWRKALLLLASAAVAYAAAVVVNTVRICAAISLRGLELPIEALTRADLHRVLGVVVYLSALCALYTAGEAILLRRNRGRTSAP